MSPNTHIIAGFTAQAIPLIAGGVWMIFSGLQGTAQAFAFVATMVVVFAVGYLWRSQVPARCPVAGCGGPAYCHGSHPISFTCRKCGHIHRTTLHDGDVGD